MSEFTPRNHEQRTHKPESYRALGRAAAGDVGAFPVIRPEGGPEVTQPIRVQELAKNRPNDRPERIFKEGAAFTNVDSAMIDQANSRRAQKMRSALEDTQPQPVVTTQHLEEYRKRYGDAAIDGPKTSTHGPDQFRNPDGSFNREAYIRFHANDR